MEKWEKFLEKAYTGDISAELLKQIAFDRFEDYGVYPDSIRYFRGSLFFIAREKKRKVLVICGESGIYTEFKGGETQVGHAKVKSCELSKENCVSLRKNFSFTCPVSHKGNKTTIGLGDRLGLASAGHLRLIKDKPVFPVLAQQSMRELRFTGRNYDDVLSSASWAVFQEGYEKGFGADGDHLKTVDEVKTAIDSGYTMITLDCSERINHEIFSASPDEVGREYEKLPQDKRNRIESKYLGKEFDLGNKTKIVFTADELKKIALVYIDAIDFTTEIFKKTIKASDKDIDFEMSIDEILIATSPESHFFVASELISAKVAVTSLAPRFCGEFQKGVDYIGDVGRFQKEFETHFRIAEYFGYKLSVHSGSDKFSVFPAIAEETGGKYHLKTAGTSWLEAVRIIAKVKPPLYRRMHKFALLNLEQAKKYYHITADPSKIPDIDAMSDGELPELMDMNDARQVLHITYGLILLDRKPDGTSTFRDEIYEALNEHEKEYYDALSGHIGRHLNLLRV
jgi:hypothetical protein